MKRYTDTSTIYEGLASSFFFIEEAGNNELNSLIKDYHDYFVMRMRLKGVEIADFCIIPNAKTETESYRNLILRQQPSLDLATLEKNVEALQKRGNKGKLFFINSAGYDIDGNFNADIICEDNFGSSIPEYASCLDKFIEAIAECNRKETRIETIRYRIHLHDDEDELKTDDNRECLCNDLLAASICNAEHTEISPILFDEEFNITLPLYPQVKITLEPLPKTLYILFLQHPEGIILKDIHLYEDELKKIYSHVSGRQNPTVINRMFRSLVDPTETPLHKNLSIIRKCFTSKLNYNIARNYIPAHGRKMAHNIPLESEMVILPEIA